MVGDLFNRFNEEIISLDFKQYLFVRNLKLYTISNLISIENDLCKIQNGRHIQNVKPGKIYPDEEFSHLIKAFSIKDSISFKEVRGKKSCDLFYNTKVEEDISNAFTIGADCMRFERCQEYFDIVRDNSKIFSVLYAFREDVISSNNVCGFVILIKANGAIYYDRIYSYSIQDQLLIEKYCLEKRYKNCYLTHISGMIKSISVNLDKWEYEKYPYFDSLRYLNLKNGVLTNSDYYHRRHINSVCLRGHLGNFITK